MVYATKKGFSLLELLAVVAILAVIAVVIVPRFGSTATKAKRAACQGQVTDIELKAQLWLRAKGAFPQADLSDIGADVTYFPGGLPKCPVDGSVYTMDTASGTVVGHSH